jgi:hypothetical protein
MHSSTITKPMHSSTITKPMHSFTITKPVHSSTITKPMHSCTITKPMHSSTSVKIRRCCCRAIRVSPIHLPTVIALAQSPQITLAPLFHPSHTHLHPSPFICTYPSLNASSPLMRSFYPFITLTHFHHQSLRLPTQSPHLATSASQL